MAALGAAAGAFEGDNAREEQRARRIGLGLQAASLAQQDRQFAERQKLQREDMALEDQRIREDRRINDERANIEQRNKDRTFTLDENKFKASQERDLYQRGRNEQQDAWQAALDEETLRNKQMEYKTNEQLYQEAVKQRQFDDEKLSNRKKIVQGAMGVAIRAIAESPNNVLSPSQIEYIKKLDPETYGNLVGGYGAGTGKPAALSFRDPQTGKVNDEVIDPDKQFMIYETVYGKDVADRLTRRQEQEAQNAFNLKRDEARYNSQLERDKLKAGNIMDPMKKIRYTALQREHGIALKALLSGSPEEDDAEGYKQKKDALERIEREMVALEGVGSPSDNPVEAPGTKYGLSKTGKRSQSSTDQNMYFLKKLKQEAIAAHPGDEAKQIEYFKRKLDNSKQKKATPANSVTILAPDGKTGTVKKEAADKYLQQPGFSVVGESQQDSGAWRGTASTARRTPLIETNMNNQQTRGNNTLSSSASRLPKKQDEQLTAEEDERAIQAIYAESLRNPIDPVTKLPIEPTIYRKQKTREYFENKKRMDEEQFNRLYGEQLKR